MLNIGPQELLLILVVALVVVGPRRLPELSRSIGKALRSLRTAQDEMRRTVNEVLEPTAVREVTRDLRATRDEVRDALRPDPPAERRAAASPSPSPAVSESSGPGAASATPPDPSSGPDGTVEPAG